MDVAGEQQLDVEHNLFKQRLDKDLKPVSEEAEKHGNDLSQQYYSSTDPGTDRPLSRVYCGHSKLILVFTHILLLTQC